MKKYFFLILVLMVIPLVHNSFAQVFTYDVDFYCPPELLGPYEGFFETRPYIKICPINVLKTPSPPTPPLCEALDEIKITSNNNFNMNLDETKNADLVIEWEGKSDLIINDILVSNSGPIKVGFPKDLQFKSTGDTTISKIPYVIQTPENECLSIQTSNCVFTDKTYQIPISIKSESCQEEINLNTTISVSFEDPFELFLSTLQDLGIPPEWLFFIILGIFLFLIIIGRRRKNKHNKLRWTNRIK